MPTEGEIAARLHSGEDVDLGTFGKWQLRVYEAYESRNPVTGESLQAPEQRLHHFRAGAELSRALADASASTSFAPFEAAALESLRHTQVCSIGDAGRLEARPQPARSALNPQTGQKLEIPARLRVVFCPSRKLVARFQDPSTVTFRIGAELVFDGRDEGADAAR